jgi:putative oxidoreductase
VGEVSLPDSAYIRHSCKQASGVISQCLHFSTSSTSRPPPNPLAIQFLVSVSESHFAAFFFAIQLLGELMLLSGYFVPLAVMLLAAELYNILAFHLTLAPASIAPALVASILWVVVFLQYRESFKGIFGAKPAKQA